VNQAQETATAPGTVVSIWRYPVKSMLGEELNSSYVTEHGLVGDRTYALIDQETGKVASDKNPRKWGKLFFRAAFIEDPPQVVENIPAVRITFLDGTQIFSSDQDYINHAFSKVLSRDARFMRATSLHKYASGSSGMDKRIMLEAKM
jgi:MOSC domain-containing protein